MDRGEVVTVGDGTKYMVSKSILLNMSMAVMSDSHREKLQGFVQAPHSSLMVRLTTAVTLSANALTSHGRPKIKDDMCTRPSGSFSMPKPVIHRIRYASVAWPRMQQGCRLKR